LKSDSFQFSNKNNTSANARLDFLDNISKQIVHACDETPREYVS
jgi:hypothetical protein